MPDADVILQSSDLVNFRVQRSILATSSAFFGDLFSLPQPSDNDVIDGLPVVHPPEDAEVLSCLVTMLYPVPSELPDSDDKILALLAACQKYDMTTVQSSVRAEVSRRGLLLPTGTESFRLFAVAYRKRLIPEMKALARLTLGYMMMFECLGEALRSFEGWVLFDLYRFHRCYRDSITSLFNYMLPDCRSGPSKIWVGCPTTRRSVLGALHTEDNLSDLPYWIYNAFIMAMMRSASSPSVTPSIFREEYTKALQGHISETDCIFCMKTHALKGDEFYAEVENKLAQAWDVQYSFRIENPASESTPPPSV
ncbi:hypothetical protein EDB86DRAFT_1109918 [Lactarius hatsudake]|nr:hypothetical protein EDB86DRAFT_1109918 [Lactarius hatsudake]